MSLNKTIQIDWIKTLLEISVLPSVFDFSFCGDEMPYYSSFVSVAVIKSSEKSKGLFILQL